MSPVASACQMCVAGERTMSANGVSPAASDADDPIASTRQSDRFGVSEARVSQLRRKVRAGMAGVPGGRRRED